MRHLIDRPLIARLFQNRLALLGIMFLIQLQFFTINLLNATLRAPDAGWELKIALVDDHLTPNGLWLIPYFVGFFFAFLVPLWAMFTMPTTLFRQFVIAMMLAATFSYAIYILVPTYVVKPAPQDVRGDHVLAEFLRDTYEADAAASTHNAAPSQHVFYALINMCFVIRFRPRWRVVACWVPLAALIVSSALLTMRHNSPDLIAGYLVAIGAYYAGLRFGARVTDTLGDADAPSAAVSLTWRTRRRLVDYRRRWRQRARGMGADAT